MCGRVAVTLPAHGYLAFEVIARKRKRSEVGLVQGLPCLQYSLMLTDQCTRIISDPKDAEVGHIRRGVGRRIIVCAYVGDLPGALENLR